MRGAFAATLAELATSDPRIVLLTGDLGYMALEPFSDAHPDRFFNVGVAEQNMTGIATGLAEAGFIPFVYSIVTFATLRPYEFIRNGPVQHRLPVRIVGVGGGMEYGTNGLSHYGLEDIAVMRVQPGLKVLCPAEAKQVPSILRQTYQLPGPIYYRLGKDDRTVVPGLEGRFELNRVQTLGEGGDVLFVVTGAVAVEATAAADLLAARGIMATVVVVNAFNPAPVDDLVAHLQEFPLAFAVEEHYITGGLGSMVAEVIAERNLGTRLVRCGVRTLPQGISGSQKYLRERHCISAAALQASVLHELKVPA